MQTNACHQTGPHDSGGMLPTVLVIIAALTDSQRQQLQDFARKRMGRLSRSPGLARFLAQQSPDDLVNSALEKLLLGDVDAGHIFKSRSWFRAFPHTGTKRMENQITELISLPVSNCHFGKVRIDLFHFGH